MTFKPYRHAGCIIYTGKNRLFLEMLAEKLKAMTHKDKQKLDGKAQNYGGMRYALSAIPPEGQLSVWTVPQSLKRGAKMVMSEDYK
jgi:hypothetical protein